MINSSTRCWSTDTSPFLQVGWTMKTSVPRMFSSIWNETSESGKRRSRACPTGTPRKAAISFASSGWARPEKTLSSPNPIPVNGSLMSPHSCLAQNRTVGWGGRIRTFEYGIQSPAPYRLATPHCSHGSTRPVSPSACFEKTPRSESCSHLAPVGGVGGSEPQDGPNHAARKISLSDGLIWRQVAQGITWDAQRPIPGGSYGLRYDRPISAPGERAGRSFCPGSRIEETEYRRTAARHRRKSSAQSAQLGYDSSNLRVMGGHDRLEVVHDLPNGQHGLVGDAQAPDSAPYWRSRAVEPTIGALRADAK